MIVDAQGGVSTPDSDVEDADAQGVNAVVQPVAQKAEEESRHKSQSANAASTSSGALIQHRSAVRDPGTYSYGLVYVFWSLSFYEQQYFLKKQAQKDLDEGRRQRKDMSKENDMVKKLMRTKRFVWEPQINNPERTIIAINKEINTLTNDIERTDRTVEILMRFMAGKELMFHRLSSSAGVDTTQMRVLPEPTRTSISIG